MKVTVLAENSAGQTPGVQAEFGLSLLIESSGGSILLDTGASGCFAENAKALGVDLERVDVLAISHGHYDHGGGIVDFLRENSRAPVFLRRGAEGAYYGSLSPNLPAWLHRAGLITRYIGLDPEALHEGERAGRIRWVDENTEPLPGVRLLTRITRRHSIPRGNRFLLAEKDGRFLPDDFSHELLLVVQEEGSSVIFSGCAHNGILNLLESARGDAPDQPIRAVAGGFHLNLPRKETMSAPPEEIRALAATLGEEVSGPIYTGHCTGAEAFSVMKEVLGERLHALHTGDRFEL